MIKNIFIFGVMLLILGFLLSEINPPEPEPIKQNKDNPPPDPNRVAVDYDWTLGRYIYQDELQYPIKTGDGYVHKDSYIIPEYMQDSITWEHQGFDLEDLIEELQDDY